MDHQTTGEIRVDRMDHQTTGEIRVDRMDHQTTGEIRVDRMDHQTTGEIRVDRMDHQTTGEIRVDRMDHQTTGEIRVDRMDHQTGEVKSGKSWQSRSGRNRPSDPNKQNATIKHQAADVRCYTMLFDDSGYSPVCLIYVSVHTCKSWQRPIQRIGWPLFYTLWLAKWDLLGLVTG